MWQQSSRALLGAVVCLLAVGCARARSEMAQDASAPGASARRANAAPSDDDSADASGEPANAVGAADDSAPVLSVSAEQLANELAELRDLEYEWRPWWLAPDEARRGFMSVRIAVTELNTDKPLYPRLEASIVVADRDGRFEASFAATFQASFEAGLLSEGAVVLAARFDHEALARQLGLPTPVPASGAADPFDLVLSRLDGIWSLALFSHRGTATCSLLGSVRPTRSRCDGYDVHFQRLDDMRVREVALDEVLEGGISTRSAVDAMQNQGDLELAWPDGSVTRFEAIVEEAEDFGCLSTGLIPELPSDAIATDWPVGERLTQLSTPVRFIVATEDGRLRAELPGTLDIDVWDDGGWDGTVSGFAGMANVEWLLERGQHPGFEAPTARLAFLSLTLGAPPDTGLPARLELSAWKPYAGVPEYPRVYESSTNRVTCFADYALDENQRARISRIEGD